MSDDTDEELDEETRERVDRVRGKRDSRPSRRRSRRDADAEQAPQATQEKQENSSKQAEAADTDTMDGNTQTVTENESEKAQSEQGPQAAQAEGEEQANVSDLDPVTQRRHDTYYLSKEVTEELERVYRRMSLTVLEETGVDLDNQRVGGRNRYYRPLALLLGARQIAEMSPAELRESIEEEDLIDDLPESE